MAAQPQKPAWSDDQLPAAVAAATSWRGVMRELGLNPKNGGVTHTVRRHAAWLGLDTSHFKGNRSWSDAVLRQAVAESRTWEEVLIALGLSARAGGERTLVKAHALRLGLDLSHLGQPAPHRAASCELRPDLANLRQAAESLAATWFVLCGCNVAFPAVPDCYDLLVSTSDSMKRVQVKTTTCNTKVGWKATGRQAPLLDREQRVARTVRPRGDRHVLRCRRGSHDLCDSQPCLRRTHANPLALIYEIHRRERVRAHGLCGRARRNLSHRTAGTRRGRVNAALAGSYHVRGGTAEGDPLVVATARHVVHTERRGWAVEGTWHSPLGLRR